MEVVCAKPTKPIPGKIFQLKWQITSWSTEVEQMVTQVCTYIYNNNATQFIAGKHPLTLHIIHIIKRNEFEVIYWVEKMISKVCLLPAMRKISSFKKVYYEYYCLSELRLNWTIWIWKLIAIHLISLFKNKGVILKYNNFKFMSSLFPISVVRVFHDFKIQFYYFFNMRVRNLI